jgi:predicted RNase H-like HicB family nuclease
MVWEEDGVYVSRCVELEVASCGNTPKEALAMLREAVDLYLENAEAYNMLDELPGPLQAQEKYTTTIEVETT